MAYVDAFVLPVLLQREDEYRRWAEHACDVWIEHGALSYAECRAEDVSPGKLTSFPQAVMLEPGEVVYIIYATYRDRAHRDAVMGLVMADQRLADMMKDSPANMQRMIFGGFDVVVSATAP